MLEISHRAVAEAHSGQWLIIAIILRIHRLLQTLHPSVLVNLLPRLSATLALACLQHQNKCVESLHGLVNRLAVRPGKAITGVVQFAHLYGVCFQIIELMFIRAPHHIRQTIAIVRRDEAEGLVRIVEVWYVG